MKFRPLILILCLIPLFACDKTPKPADAPARDMFARIDKNFNAAMLPLDNYFSQNAAPDEIRDFRNIKNNYNSEIKNALLQTAPAARDAALKTADDKYIPQLEMLQNRVKQRAANEYISDLENRNAVARARARNVFGPMAEAEVKTAQDKMMSEIRSALNDPGPRAAVQKVENAGNNFQNALEKTVNKYAAAQKTPPALAAKIFEPYNNAGVSAPAEPAGKRPVLTNPGLLAARPNNAPRAPANPAALNRTNGFSGGTTLSSAPKTTGGPPEFLNNYKSLPPETSDAGGLAGQDFFSKIQNDLKTVREENKRPGTNSGAGTSASGRPQIGGQSGGGSGGLVAYLPPEKIAEIKAGLDEELKENYPKIEKTYGKDAAEKHKQIIEKYKNIITEQGPARTPPEEKSAWARELEKNLITETSGNIINADYDYRANLLNNAFEELKTAARTGAPDIYDILSRLQKETADKLKNIKETPREIIIAPDGKIITQDQQYGNEVNEMSAGLAAQIEPLINELQKRAQAAGQ